ncbi:MAG TPA: hypothetical protein VGK01_11915 [Candidatus Angelobacter sp.]|jgi:hypothetical protein
MAMTLDEQLARLSKRWRKTISPVPDESIFIDLISRCSYLAVSHGVSAAIRRYGRGGMDFNYAVNYMAKAALNKNKEKSPFKPPIDWI